MHVPDSIPDFQASYSPPQFINITSDGGNIGRFHWVNQRSFTMSAFNRQGSLVYYKVETLRGFSSFLSTMFDYHCWDYAD